jgi:Holliday junction DNA helicase RuvA
MISTLHGTLLSKSPTELVVDVGGVGYGVHIPLSTYEATGDVGSTVRLYTHLHVREDVLQLYGFASEQERSTFRLLVSVNGVGPRMAQGILSGSSVSEFKNHILQGDLSALTAIPGVGRKMAERLIVELREKVEPAEPEPPIGAGIADPQSQARSEALLALVSLGYTRTIAERAIRAAIQESGSSSVEVLIKTALRNAAK